jgi:chaperonin GroES
MKLTPENKLKKLIVVGDRVLIKPGKQNDKTASGLYLPPGVQEKEKIQSGYVIKVGPGEIPSATGAGRRPRHFPSEGGH